VDGDLPSVTAMFAMTPGAYDFLIVLAIVLILVRKRLPSLCWWFGRLTRACFEVIPTVAGRTGSAKVESKRRAGAGPQRERSEFVAGGEWWATIHVSPTAPIEVTEAAYRELARKDHPDRWGTSDSAKIRAAEVRMKTLNAATDSARIAVARRT